MVDSTLATLALYPNSGRAANSANGNASLAPQYPREFASWSASGARKPMLSPTANGHTTLTNGIGGEGLRRSSNRRSTSGMGGDGTDPLTTRCGRPLVIGIVR